MIFITGPLYSGKRTFANALPGTRIAEVQNLAKDADDLEKLADKLSAYDIVLRGAAAWSPWTPESGPRGKLPGGWPVCWPAGPNASYRCSAASPPS